MASHGAARRQSAAQVSAVPNATLLLSCPDAKGIVASVARFVFDHGGNIVHADQHTDAGEGWFVQRVEWQLDDFDLERSAIRLAFADIARHFDMRWSLHFSDDVRRTALFVSQREHCLYDLVVLARYMQVFSAAFVDAAPECMINIHHSFLPAFAGARPYHQAHEK